MTDAILTQALAFARRGLRVLPLHNPTDRGCSCGNAGCTSVGKHPHGRLAPKGCHSAVTDPAIIRRWFAGAPYNLGLATGAPSGIVVIDIDPRHGGDESLAELEQRYGPIPPTWRFWTGGGGQHLLFSHPGGHVPLSAGAVGAGIDVRGDGGYIAAPPSRHASGRRYAIDVDRHPDDVPLAAMPPWLAGLFVTPAERPKARTMPETWRRLVAEGIAEGRRNDAIARLAGLLLRRRVDPLVTLDLCRSWNSARCRPALHDDEVIRTVNSICARELRRRTASAK
jgi:putative DNA primase/helicase